MYGSNPRATRPERQTRRTDPLTRPSIHPPTHPHVHPPTYLFLSSRLQQTPGFFPHPALRRRSAPSLPRGGTFLASGRGHHRHRMFARSVAAAPAPAVCLLRTDPSPHLVRRIQGRTSTVHGNKASDPGEAQPRVAAAGVAVVVVGVGGVRCAGFNERSVDIIDSINSTRSNPATFHDTPPHASGSPTACQDTQQRSKSRYFRPSMQQPPPSSPVIVF